MNARITYEVRQLLHPFDKKMREGGVEAWCLVEIITPEKGPKPNGKPIAIFNLDSEAERFQGHVHAEGLDGHLVSIHPLLKEAYGVPKRDVAKEAAKRALDEASAIVRAEMDRAALDPNPRVVLGKVERLIQQYRDGLL